MKMMLILFGASAFVYFVSGVNGWFTKRARLYFAMWTFFFVYLVAMFLIFLGNL